MKIFQCFAGGYYTSGMCLVAAVTEEHALELANEATNPKWKLTYYGFRGCPVVAETNDTTPNARVLAIHEYGLPNMPAKGSGIKVTF